MNTFGTTSVKAPLCDPRDVRKNRMRFKREAIPLLDRVTSFYCPAGRWPSRGYILVARRDYDKIDRLSTDLRLTVDTLEFSGLAIVTAQCVTTGLAADPNALYLVELTDKRGILWNKWFAEPPPRAGYNCNSVCDDDYFSDTLNSGTPWTWSTLVGDLWPFGSYSGLPITPLGLPEDIWCTGVAAWPLLCDILEHLGLTIAVDPSANSYTIVESESVVTAITQHPDDDLAHIADGAGRIPRYVTVNFRWRDRDELQYAAMPAYSYTGDLGSYTGSHSLWDTFTIRHGDDFAADTAAADAIAIERIAQYYLRIQGAQYKVYSGVKPYYPNAQVDCVRWQHTEQGWRTTLASGDTWPELWAELEHKPVDLRPAEYCKNYHFGVSLTTITACVDDQLGSGIAMFYSVSSTGIMAETGTAALVWNPCSEIASGWKLHLHREPEYGELLAMPACAFTGAGPGEELTTDTFLVKEYFTTDTFLIKHPVEELTTDTFLMKTPFLEMTTDSFLVKHPYEKTTTDTFLGMEFGEYTKTDTFLMADWDEKVITDTFLINAPYEKTTTDTWLMADWDEQITTDTYLEVAGITVGCCGNSIPTTLYLSATDTIEPPCECLFETVTLTYTPGTMTTAGTQNAWIGSGVAGSCGNTFTFALWCNESNEWKFDLIWSGTCDDYEDDNISNVDSCNPLTMNSTLFGSGVDTSCVCNSSGNYEIHITETAP